MKVVSSPIILAVSFFFIGAVATRADGPATSIPNPDRTDPAQCQPLAPNLMLDTTTLNVYLRAARMANNLLIHPANVPPPPADPVSATVDVHEIKYPDPMAPVVDSTKSPIEKIYPLPGSIYILELKKTSDIVAYGKKSMTNDGGEGKIYVGNLLIASGSAHIGQDQLKLSPALNINMFDIPLWGGATLSPVAVAAGEFDIGQKSGIMSAGGTIAPGFGFTLTVPTNTRFPIRTGVQTAPEIHFNSGAGSPELGGRLNLTAELLMF